MTHSYVGHGLGIELMLCALYLKRFDLTKSLLFDTFCITFCTNCYMLVHIIHTLIRARTHYTRARAHPHKNAHAQHMTHSSAHAQTRMHPGTCGLTTHAHTHPRMNTRAYMRTHTRYARTQAHSFTHFIMHMRAYARARANTPAHAHALV